MRRFVDAVMERLQDMLERLGEHVLGALTHVAGWVVEWVQKKLAADREARRFFSSRSRSGGRSSRSS